MYSISSSFVYYGMVLPNLEGIEQLLGTFSSVGPSVRLPDGRMLPPQGGYDLPRAQAIAEEAASSFRESFRNNSTRFVSHCFAEAPFDGLSVHVTKLKGDKHYLLQIGLDPEFYRSGQIEQFNQGPGNQIEEGLANLLGIKRILRRAEILVEPPRDIFLGGRFDKGLIIATLESSGLPFSYEGGEQPAASKFKIVFRPHRLEELDAENEALIIRIVERTRGSLRSILSQCPYR